MTWEVEGAVYRSVEGGAFLAAWWDIPFVLPCAVERWAAVDAHWLRRVEEDASVRFVLRSPVP
jgi:hypothetical protein